MYINTIYKLKCKASFLLGDYLFKRCNGATRCAPCNVRLPSCKNKPDGPNPLERANGQPTSKYHVCLHGRYMLDDECGVGDDGKKQVFDISLRKCVKYENSHFRRN